MKAFDPFAGHELTHTAPTTPPQQEILMAVTLGGVEANLAYNEFGSLAFEGPIDLAVLSRSWSALVRRHEILRTTFSADGSTLCIEKEPREDLASEDWSGAADRDQKRQAFLNQEVSTPFDLTASPPFRARWISYGPGRSEFFLTAHHAVCDGYSFGVLFSELPQLYNAFLTGKEPGLPEAPRYTDYSLELNRILGGADGAAAERHWVAVLGSKPEALDLPVDAGRPADRTYTARRDDILLPKSLLEDIRSLAKKTGVSLSAAFLAAWNAYFWRLTGQTEFVMGMPSAGQTLPGFDGLVGHCVNTLPLPVRIDPKASFADLAKATRSSILDGLENQVLSFGGLLQKLQVSRDPSRIPLVPVLFNIDPPVRLPAFGAAKAESHSHPRKFDAFEIFVNGTEKDEGLILEYTYNTDLFRPETIRRWAEGFTVLLGSILKAPQAPLYELEVLTPSESDLLNRWNRTERPLPEGATALSLIEAQAAKTPQSLAVRDGKTALTYRDLLQRANFLAQRLEALGVGAGDLVGVSVSRSVQMAAALLAVWKVRAAYVPLDPDFPPDRLAFIVEDAEIKVLVTESALADVFPAGGPARLWLDKETGSSPDAPAARGVPSDAAYVLHTSGSTGKPKGVQVEQGNLVNFLVSMASDLSLGAQDVLVAVTTLSFDIAGLELYLPLSIGAQTVIATREDALDGGRLGRLLEQSAATVLQATPATWQLLLEAGWKGPQGFKALCGGEALPRELARKLVTAVTELWNVYGPTETTIWSTLEKITDPEAPISIGRPLANTTLHIVDAHLRRVPLGAPGELLIGGLGVARGYHKRPELTADRFLPDPFAQAPGARVYRTGDVCRFGPDGRVYYQRRNDSQVKVRGFRIELGEIETALAQVAGVQNAVAVVREFGPGDVRLVGYYVAKGASAPDQAVLKAALVKALPHYMVPQHLVALPELPLTPNGKIDRKALPMPNDTAGEAEAVAEPVTEVQKQIHAIWTELLRQSRVGIQSSFFDLGGHSMLAARMLGRIRDTMGVDLPMRVVFQAQTIEALANRVEASRLAAGPAQAAGAVEELEF